MARPESIKHRINGKEPHIRSQRGGLSTILQVNLKPNVLVRKCGVLWNDELGQGAIFSSKTHEWSLGYLKGSTTLFITGVHSILALTQIQFERPSVFQ